MKTVGSIKMLRRAVPVPTMTTSLTSGDDCLLKPCFPSHIMLHGNSHPFSLLSCSRRYVTTTKKEIQREDDGGASAVNHRNATRNIAGAVPMSGSSGSDENHNADLRSSSSELNLSAAGIIASTVGSRRSLYNATLPLLLRRSQSHANSNKKSEVAAESMVDSEMQPGGNPAADESSDEKSARQSSSGSSPSEHHHHHQHKTQTAVENEAKEIRNAFRVSMQQRLGGNKTLQKYISQLSAAEYDHAAQALLGSQEGGLQINAPTYETYLALLLRAGQLRIAMDTYQEMLRRRVTPSTKTYNALIALTVDRELPDAAITLVTEMRRRGRAPDLKTHELHLTALSQFTPARWQEAVVIFDNIQRRAHAHKKDDDIRDPDGKASHLLDDRIPKAGTYKALMQVYSRMEPFDWRVVYNAYYELRYHRPRIPFGPDTYEVVANAMARGGAGYPRRFLTWMDAQLIMAKPGTQLFWWGVCVTVIVSGLIKVVGVGGAKAFRRWRGIGIDNNDKPAQSLSDDIFIDKNKGGLGVSPTIPKEKTAFQKWFG